MKTVIFFIFALCALGSLRAGTDYATFAQEQEAQIAAKVQREKFALRQQQVEFICRQSYALRIQKERTIALRSGKLTTPEVERLRAERKALFEQLEALDQQISEASLQAPEMLALKAIEEENNKRIEVLRQSIMPQPEAAQSQPDVTP